MADERTTAALARIDAALARIEACETRAASVDDALARKHAALRSAVEGTLGELDALIGKLER